MADAAESQHPDAHRRSVPPVLAAILVAGLLLRGGLWLVWKDMPVRIVDAQDYNQLALRLLETGSYIGSNGERISLRPPLYPLLVAGIYRLFGAENYAAVRAAQALLSLLTVCGVYLLGRQLFTRSVALWAAAGTCFYPSLLGFNNLLLSETLFTFFVVAVTLSVVYAIRRESLGWLMATGVLLALGALVRSILWLFAPFLALFVVITWPGSLMQRGGRTVALLVPFLVILAPWIYRNTVLHRTVTIIDVMGGRNAMMGNYEHTPLERSWATISIVEGEKQWFRVLQRETPNYSDLTQGEIDKLAMKHGVRFVLTHPVLTAQRDLVRFFNFWQLDRTLVAGAMQGIFGDIPRWLILALAVVICGSYAVVLFSGVFAVVLAPPVEWRFHGLLLLTILFPCAIHTLIFAHSRYHLPIIPILMLYAASAWVNWPALWARRHTWVFRGATLVCVVFALAWLRELIVVDFRQMVG